MNSAKIWPECDDLTCERVSEAIMSRRWAIAQQGGKSFIDLAEASAAMLFGRKRAVTTCNGSAAIVIALEALGIGPGDGVLVPATTWIGCVSAINRTGAIAILVDSEVGSPLMSIEGIDPALEMHVRAILAVHTYASRLYLPDWKKAFPHAKIIEDSSHSFTMSPEADVTICSLQATKILTCGEGGLALTDDEELGRKMEALRADGRHRDVESENGMSSVSVSLMGSNYAMSEVTAALLLDQMTRFHDQCARRSAGLAKSGIGVLRSYLSREAETSGAFYGVPVCARDPEEALRRLRTKNWPWTATRAYPPIPDTHVSFVRRSYGETSDITEHIRNSLYFYDHTIVIPHEAFLDPPEDLFDVLVDLA